MLFEVVTIDLHYMTDRQQRFDLKMSKLKILWNQRHILDALEVSQNISKMNFKVNYPFNYIQHRTLFLLKMKRYITKIFVHCYFVIAIVLTNVNMQYIL